MTPDGISIELLQARESAGACRTLDQHGQHRFMVIEVPAGSRRGTGSVVQ
jgi:hypothetical protein